jgi:GT2 family glycosyltransferase/SAM-dependent methyltransferase
MVKQQEELIASPVGYKQSAPTLSQIFIEHDGYVSDMWEQYLPAYEAIFHGFLERQMPIRLLEIGVQNGGSLQIWSKYFPPGSTIVGIDRDPACAAFATETNISVRIGDATNKDVLDRILGGAQFDVVIDNGSHRSDHVIAAFSACFGRLSPGGLYIVEDLHCSYHSSHGGGFRLAGSSMEWFKGLADAVNADHFEPDASAKLDGTEFHRLRELGGNIARITFFDSLVAVEKLTNEKRQPYRRIVTGRNARVVDVVSSITLVPNALRTLLLSPTAAGAFTPELLDKLASAHEEVGRLRATLVHAEARAGEVHITSARAEKRLLEVAADLAEEVRLRTEAEQRSALSEGRLAEETRLRAEAEQRAAQMNSDLAAAEERIAVHKQQLLNLGARAAQLEAEHDGLRHEHDIFLRSTFWRLTGPARRLAAALPPSLRCQLRRSARFAYWLATPHRVAERVAYFRARKAEGSVAVEDSIHGPIWGRAVDAAIRCLKKPSFESEVAVFATYSPDGWLMPHVLHYVESLRREGIAVVVVANTDEACKFGNADLLSRVDGLYIREAKGYDFAAWAHVFQLHRELLDVTILYLINDSLIGPFDRAAFSNLIRRIRTSEADVVGLTECLATRRHLQSFFLAFRRPALQTDAFVEFFEGVVCYKDKRDVIGAYELRLAEALKRAGLRCEPLFHVLDGRNTATYRWRELIDLGFPFVKAELLRYAIPQVRPSDCLNLLSERGFDLRLVQDPAPTNVQRSDADLPEPKIVPAPIEPVVYGWPGEITIRAAAALAEISRQLQSEQTLEAVDKAKDRYQAAKLRAIRNHDDELLAEFRAAMSIWAAGAGGSVGVEEVTRAAGVMPRYEPPAMPAEHLPTPILRRYREMQVATSRRLRLDHRLVGTRAGVVTISILMPVFRTPVIYLERALLSVICQTYRGWELCVVDNGSDDDSISAVLDYYEALDRRVHVARIAKNAGISVATNMALEMATGSYIGLLDSDDMLTYDALENVVNHLANDLSIDLLYTDECKIDEQNIVQQLMPKPDWSPLLLTAFMYTGHFSIYRTSVVRQLGGLRSQYDFSQDYDLALRVADLNPRVAHIRGYYYGWRMISGSAAIGEKPHARESNIAALQDAMDRRGWGGTAIALPTANRALRTISDDRRLVSIVIPTGGNIRLLTRCLSAIFERSLYRNVEVVVVRNSATMLEALPYLEMLSRDPQISVVDTKRPYNFSESCNLGARVAHGEVVIFYNDDVFVISPDWIQTLLESVTLPGVGAVAPKLLYKDNSIQHAGMVTATRRLLGTAFHTYPRDTTANVNLAQSVREVSLLSAACLAMRKTVFDEVGGFDEMNTPREHSDVDLCFRLRERGYSCLYTPHAELTHLGHVSMGAEEAERKTYTKGKHDIYLMKRFGSFIADDPYFPQTMRDILYTDAQEAFRFFPRNPVPPDVSIVTNSSAQSLDILIFSHDFSESGAPRAAFDVARALRNAGHFVVVASPSDGPYRERLRNIGIDVVVDEVLLERNRDVFDLARNFDKVICNTIVCWPAVAQLREVVDVYWYMHESEEIRHLAESIPEFAALLKKGIPTWADSLLAARFLAMYDVEHCIIEYGIDDRAGLRPTPRSDAEKVVIGVFGSYERRKGQDLAVEGMLRVPQKLQMQTELRLFGRSLASQRCFRDDLKRIAGGNRSIVFFGEVDHDECLRHMAACDVILIPSRDDALSFVALDALSLGKAVVCSRTTGASEYLQDGQSMLILRENTSEEVSRVLSRVIADAELRTTLGRGAREVYERAFTMQGFTDKLLTALGLERNAPVTA